MLNGPHIRTYLGLSSIPRVLCIWRPICTPLKTVVIAFLYALSFKYICLEGSIVENRLGYELASSVSIVIMKMPLIKSLNFLCKLLSLSFALLP